MPEESVKAKKPYAGSISQQKQQNSRILRIITIVEIALIAVCSILCIVAVRSIASYDSYYNIFYAFPIIGAIMVLVLILAYIRKWIGIQLLSVIIVIFWTSFCLMTVYSCFLASHVQKREAPYRNSEMSVIFNGKLYTWDGSTVVYGLPGEWEKLDQRVTIVSRDDSKTPTEELHSKGIDAGSVIFYQDGYKYILVEVVDSSLFEFIDPDDPPEDTISTNVTMPGLG